jgi:hypothetical protein
MISRATVARTRASSSFNFHERGRRETRRNLGVLVILGSISTSLRCLTGNPHAKTDLPRGLFPVVEGRVPRSIFRPFDVAESPAADDRVSNCFPAALPVPPCCYCRPFPQERERERERERESSSRRSSTSLRCARKNAMDTPFDFPSFMFSHRVRFISRFN